LEAKIRNLEEENGRLKREVGLCKEMERVRAVVSKMGEMVMAKGMEMSYSERQLVRELAGSRVRNNTPGFEGSEEEDTEYREFVDSYGMSNSLSAYKERAKSG
jgi:hypothetical protein